MKYDYEIKNDKLIQEAYEKGYRSQLLNEISLPAIKNVGGAIGRGLGRGARTLGNAVDSFGNAIGRGIFHNADDVAKSPLLRPVRGGNMWGPWVDWFQYFKDVLPTGMSRPFFRWIGNPSAENLQALNQILRNWEIYFENGRAYTRYTGTLRGRGYNVGPGGQGPAVPGWMERLLEIVNGMMIG